MSHTTAWGERLSDFFQTLRTVPGSRRRPWPSIDRRITMTKVAQHLWFEKEMEAAVRFYTSLIKGSSLQWISTIPADTPSGPAGSVKLAAFTIGDQRYMAIEAGPLDPFNHSFSIMVECEVQAELDRTLGCAARRRHGRAVRLAARPLGLVLAGDAKAPGRAHARSRSGQGETRCRGDVEDDQVRHCRARSGGSRYGLLSARP